MIKVTPQAEGFVKVISFNADIRIKLANCIGSQMLPVPTPTDEII
jgi:hypothetical protein